MAQQKRLAHHDLCFGCGIANVFGLQMEVARSEDGVSGRFFVKQDHQGPPGMAHGGVIAAALDETMALAVYAEGIAAYTRELALDLRAPAPVGGFVVVDARIDSREGSRLRASATARPEDEPGELLAEARATFSRATG